MKKVLVTGAAGGMGEAICAALAETGCTVWGLDRVRGKVKGVHYFTTDVTDADAIAAAYEAISRETDALDAIVHAAGIYALDSLVEMEEAEFRRVFEVNLFGVYRVNQHFLPLLSRGARVVIISSELAPLDPLPFTGIYAIAKAGLEKYADSLRMELNLLGISVSVIRPGAVRTGLLDVSVAELDRFCAKTQHYSCNAENFRRVVNSVETRAVPPTEIAARVKRALFSKHPCYCYCVNRNPLLRILSALPKRFQVWVIAKIVS